LHSLRAIPLNLPRRPTVSRSYAPLRQITFLGGDQVLAEILRWEDDKIELRLRGGQTTGVSREAIAAVGVSRGEVELLYESFELDVAAGIATPEVVVKPTIDAKWLDPARAAGGDRSLNLAGISKPLVYAFPALPEASRVQFWFRIEEDADGLKTRPTELRVDFNFQGGNDSSRWRLNATANGASISFPGGSNEPVTSQAVTLKKGWHCLTAAFLDDHAICVVDDALLMLVGRSPGRLHSIRLNGTANVWIDELQVSQFTPRSDESAVRPSTQDDCVALLDGDQWFGRVKQVSSTKVTLVGPAGARLAAWPQLDSLALRQSDRATFKREPQSGLWAAIELQANVDRPRQGSDRIVAAIAQINRDFIIVAHPWLGEIAIGWSDVARIEPLFYGTAITVDARRLHLGDAIREDFQRPTPDGTEWSGEFEIASSLPADAEVWLSLDATDLEPAGPGTPPASPFLKELRSGRLRTDLTINDHAAGDLNRWIRSRAAPAHPDRLRCRLPANLLRVGRNSFRISQVPLKETGMGYDNCELSNIRIEIVEPSLQFKSSLPFERRLPGAEFRPAASTVPVAIPVR